MTSPVYRGQLADPGWHIPAYARDVLWVQADYGCVRAEGEQGVFALESEPEQVTVRWGGADGPALACLGWRERSLGWDGTVSAGGYVDAAHITSLPGLDFPVMVFLMGGQPLKHGVAPFPTGAARTQVPYPAPNFYNGLAGDVAETNTTWLVAEHDPLAALAQDGMVNDLRLYFWGHLAEQAGGWHQHFALPLLLEAVTLFAP